MAGVWNVVKRQIRRDTPDIPWLGLRVVRRGFIFVPINRRSDGTGHTNLELRLLRLVLFPLGGTLLAGVQSKKIDRHGNLHPALDLLAL